MYNGGQAGLTFWSPNVNIFRDPRWGRGQETPGEDPAVSARYAAAYVRGLQQPYGGQHGRSHLKLAACCKHFTAYDLDRWGGTDRFHFNAVVAPQDLEDTFNVPFRACVADGKAAAVMCSYNQVNGVPTCADEGFLKGTIRGKWGLEGYIVSDCDSVDVFFNDQHYTRTTEDAVAATLRAGLDLDCGPFLAQYTESAVAKRKVSDADVDAALTNTVTVQMRLGMFDGDPAAGPFGHLGPLDVCTPAHQELALEAARQGVVLLKNEKGKHRGGVLPLRPATHRTVAVVGPHAEATVAMIGNYAGKPCGYNTPVQGVARYVHQAVHQAGCTDVACAGSSQPIAAAVDAARRADATVVVAGLDQKVEAEGLDRSSLLLPGRQAELISAVAKASKGPVILVLMSGGPIDIAFAQNDPRIAAIIWAGYPGQAGGQAIADVIFGQHNPGGKLPVTWYPQEYLQKAPMTNMAMRANPASGYPGRTYRFYTGPTIHPFGHGLSYTQFTHTLAHAPAQLTVQLAGGHAASTTTASSLLNATRSGSSSGARAVRVAHARCQGLTVPVHVDVRNIGDRDGAHTVMVYHSAPARSVAEAGAPARQLVAFEKVHVAAGGVARVEMGVGVCDGLSVAGRDGVRRIPVGEHRLVIGELTHSVTLGVEQLGSQRFLTAAGLLFAPDALRLGGSGDGAAAAAARLVHLLAFATSSLSTKARACKIENIWYPMSSSSTALHDTQGRSRPEFEGPRGEARRGAMGWAARFLAAVSFLAAGLLFAPDALRLGGPGDGDSAAATAAARLVHLLAFATAWGAGLWVTFIGGIVMFKYLPRHQFGSLQGKMFPTYFMLISVCSAISVSAFAYLHPWKTALTIERYQLGFLLSALGCNLSNLLVFTPMTVEMMMKRHKLEKDLGIGTEVGYSKNAETTKRNPGLAAMNRKFGMIHGLSSLANIMSFGSLAMHSWYLSNKLDL
ncbi:putative beta-D-xylosidase 2 [Dichanthelium oligosanthes]|uniref:Putative beta-D-xylosidase 2 n=1 Tax=Dichanthelium oligosanthes TaxID=888268 RepID=A0A1E5UZF8_9POAL|nr:putative beta-D-xylosidase 2 [Dichanthelium oligosanthes]